jgi:MFS family permease
VPTALRNADLRYLLAGNLVSGLGSWLLVVALPYQVFRLTGSVAATGLTLPVESLPAVLVGPVAGVFVDRWDRRRVMIVNDLLRAVAVAGILLADRPDRLWWLYLALAVESLGTAFFRPAARALVPGLVGTGDELVGANSFLAVNNGVVGLVGPPLGALLLVWFGLPLVVLLDVASYLVSALAVAAIRFRGAGAAGATADVLGEFVAGSRFVGRHPTLRGLLLLSTVFCTCNAVFTAVLIPFMTIRFGGPPAAVVLVTAVLLSRFVDRRS